MFAHGERIQGAFAARPFDDEHILPPLFARQSLRKRKGRRFFVEFGDLADGAGVPLAEHFEHRRNVAVDVLRGTVKEERLSGVLEAFQKTAAFARLVGQKAHKGEAGSIQRRENERRERRVRPGEHGIGHPRRPQIFTDGIAGVGDDGHARVRDDADALPLPVQGSDLLRRRVLVELMAGAEGLFDVVCGEQLDGVPRILAEDDVRRAQFFEGAQGDVLQISDGRCHKCDHISSPAAPFPSAALIFVVSAASGPAALFPAASAPILPAAAVFARVGSTSSPLFPPFFAITRER